MHSSRSPSAELLFFIDELAAQGDGVGRDGAGTKRFVAGTLAGEQVRVQVDGDKSSLIEVVEPSPERVEPPCPHFGSCGGCALQHWAPSPYLSWKRSQLIQLLARERLETQVLEVVATPPGARRRLALHARGGKGGVRLGFKARSSWDLVEISRCDLAESAIVAALPGLKELARPFLEHHKSAPTLHVTLTGTGLDVDVTGIERKSGGGLSADARVKAARLAAEQDLARLSLAGEVMYQARAPMVRLGGANVVLPPGGFLQASVPAEQAMVAFAVAYLAGAERVADLYCGIGTFTFPLAVSARVRAAESSPEAVTALKRAISTAPGLKSIEAEVRDLVRQPFLLSDLKKMDGVLLDPPRAGAAEQCRELARSKVAKVVYVSCNPATFVRDARTLVDGGYRLETILPVDQFLWSPHTELVAGFTR